MLGGGGGGQRPELSEAQRQRAEKERADLGLWGFTRCAMGEVLRSDYSLQRNEEAPQMIFKVHSNTAHSVIL